MSIIKPHKLGIVAGPGSEYFAGKVTNNLRKIYNARYEKVSDILAKRHNLSNDEVYKKITFYDDINSKNLISSKLPGIGRLRGARVQIPLSPSTK